MRVGDTSIYTSMYQKRTATETGSLTGQAVTTSTPGKPLERDQSATTLGSSLWLLQTEVFSSKAAAADAAEKDAIRTEFLELNEKSPAERVREDYLERHGLSEEDLAKMSDEERQTTEKEIQELIKRQLGFDDSSSAKPSAPAASEQG